MGLLKKLFSGSEKKQAAEDVFYEQHFTQSHSFKGYKRFNVSYYGYKPAEDGFAAFKNDGLQLNSADILLQGVTRGQFQFVDVIVNGYFIGSITMWNGDDVTKFIKDNLYNGRIEKAHIRVEQDKIHLFLK